MVNYKKMHVGEEVQCNLFEKKGVVTDAYDLSPPTGGPNGLVNMIKLVWEDGQEEVVNVTQHPQRLKKLSDIEAEKAQLDAFGADLADIDIH